MIALNLQIFDEICNKQKNVILQAIAKQIVNDIHKSSTMRIIYLQKHSIYCILKGTNAKITLNNLLVFNRKINL